MSYKFLNLQPPPPPPPPPSNVLDLSHSLALLLSLSSCKLLVEETESIVQLFSSLDFADYILVLALTCYGSLLFPENYNLIVGFRCFVRLTVAVVCVCVCEYMCVYTCVEGQDHLRSVVTYFCHVIYIFDRSGHIIEIKL